jgi:predicted Na+-dependent transporter
VGWQKNLFMIFLSECLLTKRVAQVLKPVEIGVLSLIMLIGIIALATELTEYEEIAKVVVVPSLILLILVTGYALFKAGYYPK